MADFGFIPNLTASGNIAPFRFVEINTGAAFTGQQANAASDNILGVTDGSVRRFDSTWNAIAGDQISLQPTNTVQVELGTGGCSIGSLLTSDADGKAVAGTSTQVCYYIALEAGSAGEIVRAFRIGTRIV
jgi:hypothetical protein